ncbi:glycosyltransferase family A protein [Streptomyces polygonati]|uniref:Glycosyltransferase family A protein n=1 Tax=Streptomyces polygonati TaxID=1617087 RepID=A0ABV8I3T1_9ACTN
MTGPAHRESDDGPEPEILVSVITPTRGRLDSLRRAMESVRRQTLPRVEHIVLGDDCPDLGRGGIREALAREFPAARIGNLPPRADGPAYRPARTARVRNRGIATARGRFIAHLDDDNAFEPGHLASLTAVLEADAEAVAAHSWRRLFDPEGRPFVPAGLNPWMADRAASARNYADLAGSDVFRPGSNVMRDRIRGRNGERFLLVDTSELMVRAGFHREHPFRTAYTDHEMESGLCEDRAWCVDVIGSGHRIAESRQVTLSYAMGGYSNAVAGSALRSAPDGKDDKDGRDPS